VTLPACVVEHHRVYYYKNPSNSGNAYVVLLTKIVPLPDLDVSLPWVSNDKTTSSVIFWPQHFWDSKRLV
jgi:hypothetical protein